MEPYQIYNVNLGQGTGHEQNGERPAILIKIIEEIGICIVVPLTSNLTHSALPYTVQINKTSSTNLTNNSVALVMQVRAISKMRLPNNSIGKLEEYQIRKIKSILKDMLALE